MSKKKTINESNKPCLAELDHRACADAPVNKAMTKEQKLHLLRQMVRIRRFEERSQKSYVGGNIKGFLHLYIGQEAVAVGSISVLGENDHTITAYRDHGHALMSGMGMNECMAELYGKWTGCSKGKGGSMHYFAPDKRYWGGHGIVGGQTPLGAGIAFAVKYQGKKGCCLCYMGDGAVNQGPFHEILNMASLWDIPVIFIIENNFYSMGTSVTRSSAFPEVLAKRAEGYNMAWDVCNGHIVNEVRDCVEKAVKRAHEESKPTLLEIQTYRYRGHSVADPDDTYRTKEEIEKFRTSRDPITLYLKLLLEDNVITQAEYETMDQAAKDEAEASVQFAEQSPYPPEESILQDVYWEEDNRNEKTTSQGVIFFE